MRLSPLAAGCWALLLVGLAAGLYRFYFPPGPVADEAAYVMITQSLWHDRDLAYRQEDLDRAYQIWDQGPHGLVLLTRDGGETMYYGKPLAYSLAALPFYVLFGVQGFLVLNALLFLSMVTAAWWVLRQERGEVLLFVLGFFLASAAVSYVFWAQPEVFNMACVFLPLALWQAVRRSGIWGRRELWLFGIAGVLAAATFVSKEPTVLLAGPIALDLLWQRRYKALAALAGGALVGLLLLVGLQDRLSGQWSPYRGAQRRSFENAYPYEAKSDHWQLYRGTTFGSWAVAVESNPRVWLRNLVYLFVGRHTGLLPYFPFALFTLGLYLVGPRDRAQHLLFLALAGYCVFYLLFRSHNYHGGAGFIGNRYFASVYPAALFLAAGVGSRLGLVLPFVAAALWTVPVIAVPQQRIAPEFGLQVHTRTPAFQRLPLELTLVGGRKVPGYWMRSWGEGVWIVPRHNFFAQERHANGVWVRGSSRSEVVVVAPEKLDVLRFIAYSPLPQNVLTLDGGRGKIVVPFDSEENRSGFPVELPVKLVARDLDGFFPHSEREYYYRFTLSTTHGWLPMRRDPKSTDSRYLSVFLDFTGRGP